MLVEHVFDLFPMWGDLIHFSSDKGVHFTGILFNELCKTLTSTNKDFLLNFQEIYKIVRLDLSVLSEILNFRWPKVCH